MKIKAPRRRKMRAKRLDMTKLQRALQDGKQWVTLAKVTKQDGTSAHYELVEEGGELVDILIDVDTIPEGIDLTCRLGGGAGSQGIWQIPNEGDEVLVVIPDGRIDFQPAIVAILGSSISNPSGEGPAPTRTVIMNAEVLIHSGAGGAKALAYKSDVDQLKTDLSSHTHPTGVGPSGPPVEAATWTAPVGTSILKAK